MVFFESHSFVHSFGNTDQQCFHTLTATFFLWLCTVISNADTKFLTDTNDGR